jgi:hypothetical protein
MNRIGTISLLALGVTALNAHALEVRQSPYDKIVERNLFQLHGPPITPGPDPVVTQLPKVTLTGITILERRRAFVTIDGIQSRRAESVTIAEGDTVGGIRVESIDEKAGLVRVLNGSERQILKFEPRKPSGQQFIGVEIINVVLDSNQ